MKTRFLRVIWFVSFLWIGLILFGGIFGTAKDELVLNLIVFGWPAIVGWVVCYFLGGSFGWPKEPNNDSNSNLVRPLPTLNLEPQSKASTDSSPEERFLKTIDQSRQSVMQVLAEERQKMLDEWNAKFGKQLEKFEQEKMTIRASGVIDSLIKIIHKTESWNTYLDCDLKDELIPQWIGSRLFHIVTTSKERIEFLNYNQHKSDGIEKEIGTLDDCLGIKLDDLEIGLFVYKLSEDSSYTKHGRAQLYVNSECVLDISLKQPVGEYGWNWGHEIFVASPGSWMSSVLNLSEEFQGREYIEEQEKSLREKEFFLSQNNPQGSRNIKGRSES